MASMELHYASPPPAGSARRRSSADMAAAASTSRSSQAVESSSNAKTGETPTTMNTASDNTVAVKESNTASRILDELLGDMLSIVEEQDSSSDEGGDERNVSESESWSTSSSTSDAEDNNDTLTTLTSKVGSPLTDSEKEEGELESEHELESKRIQAEAKLKEAEERKRRREEKKKQSIERNVSERDVYRYLKHRGEFCMTALSLHCNGGDTSGIEIVPDAPSYDDRRTEEYHAPQANVCINADINALLTFSHTLIETMRRPHAYLERHDIVDGLHLNPYDSRRYGTTLHPPLPSDVHPG